MSGEANVNETHVNEAPSVSVIVPCFNHGAYLDEAITSVLAQTHKDFEIIVVNDGSTEAATIKLLENYKRPKTTVIHTSNQGLAAARNNGIAQARGKYILPLDADDRIGPTYLEKAVRLLDSDDKLGIVGCKVEWFGVETGPLAFPPYSFPLILIQCLFVCTSAFRRADWEAVGGYDRNLKYGHEDWDFWISLVELGRDACRIPEVLFYYRKRFDSMLQTMKPQHKIHARAQIFRNHAKMYTDNIEVIFKKLDEIGAIGDKALKQLSDFTRAAQEGREVTICDDKGPVAKLVGLRPISKN